MKSFSTPNHSTSIKPKPFFGTSKKERRDQPFFQPKLTIGPVDDIYEREADAVADQVMRMSDNQVVQTKFSPIGIQRKCPACVEEEKAQRKETPGNSSAANEAPSIVNNVIGSGGKPLAEDTRSFMENRMGYDFSNVKIHTGSVAAKSAQSINALAYTSGSSIVFNEGQYQPETKKGKRLLAHELTHVVQQSGVSQVGNIQRYTGCTTAQDTIITDDHDRARNMLSNAITKVSSYDGTTPTKVHNALNTHFNGATSNAFATWINFNLRILWGLTWMADYVCFTNGPVERQWACRGSEYGTSFWCVPGVAIRVCPLVYFSMSNIGRSTGLIHEWIHKYGCNFDLGYEGEPEYAGNSTPEQLLNADSFAHFIRDVQ